MKNKEFIKSVSLDGEEWRDVVGFEDFYMVSSLGRIMRKFTSRPRIDGRNTAVTYPKILTPTIHHARKQNYYYVTLSVFNKRYRMLVHRIVAMAFIQNPLNRPEIDHIDGNGLNNAVSNLRWCSRSENNMNPIARKRQSDSHTGKQQPTLWVPVVCISKNGMVTYYKSMSEAVMNGFRRSAIIDSIKHPNRPIRKRQWMRLEDYESLVNQNVKERLPNAGLS